MVYFKGILFIFAIFSMKYGYSDDTLILQPDNFTSEWQLRVPKASLPAAVSKSENHLVYVTFQPNLIRLETSRILNKACNLHSSLLDVRNYSLVSPTHAVTLGNGKVVISLLQSKNLGVESNTFFDVWLYAVDLKDCSHFVDKFSLDATIDSAHIIKLIPYQDSFDVFVKSKEYCDSDSICNRRYNDELHLNESAKRSLPCHEDVWDIVTKKDFDQSEGYMYTETKKDGQILMKWLNTTLQGVQSTSIKDVNNVVYWKGESNSIGLCTSKSENELKYMLLDSNFGISYNFTLQYDMYVQKYSVFLLDNDDAVVLTVLSKQPDGYKAATYLQHIRPQSPVPTPVKFQDFVCEIVDDLKIFRIANGDYCVSVVCIKFVNVKCFTLPKSFDLRQVQALQGEIPALQSTLDADRDEQMIFPEDKGRLIFG